MLCTPHYLQLRCLRPVPTLGIKMPYEEEKKELVKTRKGRQKLVVGENDLATVAPKGRRNAE